MCILPKAFGIIILALTCYSQTGCAEVINKSKATQEDGLNVSEAESRELIVVLDDSAVLARAAEMNKRRGIMFDDTETLRFKTDSYAAMKREVLASLPAGEVEILKTYDALPLVFLRLRSARALKALLAHPSVLRVHDDSVEKALPLGTRP